MHVCCGTKTHLTTFSSGSWVKFRQCAERWKVLSGGYSEKAKEIWSALNLDETLILNNETRLRFGYHRACYQRFTDIAKLSSAEERVRVQLQQQQQQHSASASGRDEGEK